MAAYPLNGSLSVVPVADLSNAAAQVNLKGDTRKGGDSNGKHQGQMILVLNANSTRSLAVARGPLPTDIWDVFAGAVVTPA